MATLKRLYRGTPLALIGPSWQYPGQSTTGGSIPASTTRYYQATVTVGGVESLPGPELSVAVPAGTATNTVTLLCAYVPGATYNFYEGSAPGGSKAKIGSSSTPSFVDTGAAGSGSLPATSPLTEATATPGVYVTPAGKTTLLQQVSVSNPGTQRGALSLSVVPSGGSGATAVAAGRVIANQWIDSDAVAGPTLIKVSEYLAAGDFITAAVTVPGMVIGLMGVEL